MNLPSTLGDNIPSKASTALSDLHDAQGSLSAIVNCSRGPLVKFRFLM